MADFERAWRDLPPPFRRGLELAHRSLDGLAVGAVLTGGDGRIVAEGRNRAYDQRGGSDVLQGTPLAHAEMNVLAAVPTELDLGGCVLWSTQQPCSMCGAAAAFVGVGAVRFLAPDPWAIATAPQPAARPAEGAAGDVWVVSANALFLRSIAGRAGPAHPTIERNREREPETVVISELLPDAPSVTGALAPVWGRIDAAAAARGARR